MRSMRLFALSIDDLRDVFRAAPELAERLRAVAAEAFPTPKPRKVGLFRREPALHIDPAKPNAGDVSALLTGSYVAPDRLQPSWRLLLVWLDALAREHRDIAFEDLDTFEFDLARAGLPADYSLDKLAQRDLGIPLRALPGQRVGYAKHIQAVETGIELEKLAEADDEEFRPLLERLRPVREILDAVARDPRLDLVVVQTDQV